MNRREFLMSIGASLIPRIIRVSTPISPLTFYGIPVYSDPAFQVGTWMGIDRSVYPFWGGKPGGGKSIHNHITGLIKLLDETQIKKS